MYGFLKLSHHGTSCKVAVHGEQPVQRDHPVQREQGGAWATLFGAKNRQIRSFFKDKDIYISMATNTWYLPAPGGRYMSEAKQNEVYGRVTREYKQLEREVATMESELKSIGQKFVGLGNDLIGQHPRIVSTNKNDFNSDVATMWDLIEKYPKAVRDKEKKKEELDKLEGA